MVGHAVLFLLSLLGHNAAKTHGSFVANHYLRSTNCQNCFLL